ncbi:MAG: transposase [Telmatospirillum sp.]|nr:transposase [Telmatospirillum sp.]
MWQYVEKLDISSFVVSVRSFAGSGGAPTTDPRIFLPLWLFAILDGIGSARELARLCERDHAYQWICGGVTVNCHSLSDFRNNAGPFLDDLLTKSVAALVTAGIVDLSCIAVDSVRVRANAGRSSFRRKETLLELRRLARERIEQLKAENAADPTAANRRQQARRERAAREREERVEAALKAVDEIEAARVAEDKANRRKTPKKRQEARASTTDPEARRMALANGGVAPAYSVQIKTDPKAAAVIGVDVTNNGSDRGKLKPAVDEIHQRYDVLPDSVLADAGYDGQTDIEAVETKGTADHVPLPKKEKDRKPKPKDGSGVRKWKERMSGSEAQSIYANRIKTEHLHAQMRNHGLLQIPVRGLEKAKTLALWFAIATNFLLHTKALIAITA